MSLKGELEQANGRVEALEALVALLMKEVERLTFVINQNFVMSADEYCAQFAPQLSPRDLESKAMCAAKAMGEDIEAHLRLHNKLRFTFHLLHQVATGVVGQDIVNIPQQGVHLH